MQRLIFYFLISCSFVLGCASNDEKKPLVTSKIEASKQSQLANLEMRLIRHGVVLSQAYRPFPVDLNLSQIESVEVDLNEYLKISLMVLEAADQSWTKTVGIKSLEKNYANASRYLSELAFEREQAQARADAELKARLAPTVAAEREKTKLLVLEKLVLAQAVKTELHQIYIDLTKDVIILSATPGGGLESHSMYLLFQQWNAGTQESSILKLTNYLDRADELETMVQEMIQANITELMPNVKELALASENYFTMALAAQRYLDFIKP